MLRATAWTVGLFGAGTAISRAFASGWIEPLVLLALGVAFLFVSRQGGAKPVTAPQPEARPASVRPHEAGRGAPARAPVPAPALRAASAASAEPLSLRPPAPVPVPVEQ